MYLIGTLVCDFFLLLLPFFFLDTLRARHFNLAKPFFRCLLGSNLLPSLLTTYDFIPRSTPMVESGFMGGLAGSVMGSSASAEAKYLPVGVLLMVTVLILPSNRLSKTTGISFILGMVNVDLSQSILRELLGH